MLGGVFAKETHLETEFCPSIGTENVIVSQWIFFANTPNMIKQFIIP